MKKLRFGICLLGLCLLLVFHCYGEQLPETNGQIVNDKKDLISMDLKDADINNVLRMLSEQYDLNIIVGSDVSGLITVHFTDVTIEDALDAVVTVNGFSYIKRGNIISVATTANLISQMNAKKTLDEAKTVVTNIFHLKYVNASDMLKIVQKQLSSRGKADVFIKTLRGGWKVAGMGEGLAETADRKAAEKEQGSLTLVVTDIPEIIEKIKDIVVRLDVLSRQVLIDVKIIEISVDDEKQLGIKWGLSAGITGAARPHTFPFVKDTTFSKYATDDWPAATGTSPTAAVGSFTFGTVDLSALKVLFEAKEIDADYNLLSNPKILVLDNHEATILVGEKYPILKTTISGEGTVTEEFDRYESIGISLKVIPQILDGDRINMVIHPAVSSLGGEVTGTTGLKYSRVNTRETDTQVIIDDGKTIVIAGLVKDQNKETISKIPILGDIPLIGRLLFQHRSTEKDKIDLLIFITPHIVGTSRLSEKERAKLEEFTPSQKEKIRRKKK